jgi:Bacterial regulatory proteins, tetR family
MRADARRSYERLMAAAAEVFAEQGTGSALDDIAKRAGIGNATLYFPTDASGAVTWQEASVCGAGIRRRPGRLG